MEGRDFTSSIKLSSLRVGFSAGRRARAMEQAGALMIIICHRLHFGQVAPFGWGTRIEETVGELKVTRGGKGVEMGVWH